MAAYIYFPLKDFAIRGWGRIDSLNISNGVDIVKIGSGGFRLDEMAEEPELLSYYYAVKVRVDPQEQHFITTATEKVRKFLFLLRLVKENSVSTPYIYFVEDGIFESKGWSTLRDVYPQPLRTAFDVEDIGKVMLLYRNIIRMRMYHPKASLFNNLRNAIYYLESSFYIRNLEPRVLIQISAFETLFLRGRSERDKGEQIKRRVSKFLLKHGSRTGVKRLEKKLKAMYSLRNYVVHGDNLYKRYSKSSRAKLYSECESTLREVLRVILSADHLIAAFKDNGRRKAFLRNL